MDFKFINRILFSIFFCAITITITIANASNNNNNELIQLLNNIHTMQADFSQFTGDQKTSGSMALERPGKFRWEVSYPNKQLIIINKNKILLYDIDLEQIIKRKIDYKKPGNPVALLSDSTQTLEQNFTITKLKKSGEFELKPKKKNSDYKWIKMYFVSGQLKSMYIFDNLDQKSEIHFSNIVFNSKIPDSKFIFVVPKNVDVLDE